MEIPRHWRLKKQRYGLVGDVCPQGHPAFPPDDVCKKCDPDVAIADAIKQNTEKMNGEMVIYLAEMEKAQREQA